MTYRVLGVKCHVLGNTTEHLVSCTKYSVGLGGTTEYLVIQLVILGVKTLSHGEILIVHGRVEPYSELHGPQLCPLT
jgi:hypothetical protein